MQRARVIRHDDKMLNVPLSVGAGCHIAERLTGANPSGCHMVLLQIASPATNFTSISEDSRIVAKVKPAEEGLSEHKVDKGSLGKIERHIKLFQSQPYATQPQYAESRRFSLQSKSSSNWITLQSSCNPF